MTLSHGARYTCVAQPLKACSLALEKLQMEGNYTWLSAVDSGFSKLRSTGREG